MKQISIIGVPMDLGASRRGVDMGPSALRIAKVGERLKELGYRVTDRGNIEVGVQEALDGREIKSKFVDEIVEVNKKLASEVYNILKDGDIPLIMGGDHSIAMGSVAGISKFYAEKKQSIGVVWLDAHADINTPETTLSGNIHGMPVAHIIGQGDSRLLKIADRTPMIDPSKIALVGLRDLDPGEKETIKRLGIKAFTMRDIDEYGLKEVIRRAIGIASDGTIGFHFSFDIDCIDPQFAPGVGTPVPGGVTYREGHLASEMVFDTGKMISMEVTEVNPVLDMGNRTAQLAVEMILSAFGKRIL